MLTSPGAINFPNQRQVGPERLIEAVHNALVCAERSIPFIIRPIDPAAGGQAFLERTKFVSETALLLRAASRIGQLTGLSTRIDCIASAIAPVARDEHVITWMRMRPALVGELSVAHSCLAALGHPDPAFDAEIRDLTLASSIGLPERVAWKDLEADWHLGLATIGHEIDVRSAVARTAISQEQDSLFSTREAAYAATHALIYATDFGHEPNRFDLDVEALTRDATATIGRCLDEDDFDLGAEVLMTWPFLRASWHPTAVFAFAVFNDVIDDLGLLPSMTLRADEYDALDPAARSTYFFREAYHTVYVMGLLASACLLPGASPPASWRSDPSEVRLQLVDRFWRLLPERPRAAQWERRFESLEPAGQWPLIEFLAGIGIRRSVKQSDFERLHAILELYLSEGLPLSLTVVHGVELLARVTRPRWRSGNPT